jgi:hypothetical protein
MKICVLNKNNNVCVGIYDIDSIENWVDHGDLILSPRQDGQVGWILESDQSWTNPQQPSEQELWIHMKDIRNRMLSQTDKYMTSDFPLTDEQRQSWRDYRQALRDLPDNIDDINNINWPQRPV